MRDFAELVAERAPILTDGGIETRVMFETDYAMDPHIQVAAMVGDPAGGAILERIYAGYVAAAAEFRLPVVIGTPTFRASLNFVRAAELDDDAVATLNNDAVRFQHEVREASGHEPVFIAGVIGPAGDAYKPSESLGADAGAAYHRVQATALAEAGADFLFAPTFPAAAEGEGVARAMAATGLPYVVSYVLDRDGRVLDGTPLADAIAQIDDAVEPAPLMHSISCVHPTVAGVALATLRNDAPRALCRLGELKANGSRLPTTVLVQLDHPESDSPDSLAEQIWSLHDSDGLRVLGGCCGTTDAHMRALARRMAA